jgi:hypothetical protein
MNGVELCKYPGEGHRGTVRVSMLEPKRGVCLMLYGAMYE